MGTGKKKIEIKKKEKAGDRIVTFSKRKKGLFSKACQLNKLSGSHIGIIVFSPAGRPHTNAPMFDPAISRYLSSIQPASTDTYSGDAGAVSSHSGIDTNDFCAVENWGCIKEWFNHIEVDKIEKVEDLLLIKQRLEIMRERLVGKFVLLI